MREAVLGEKAGECVRRNDHRPQMREQGLDAHQTEAEPRDADARDSGGPRWVYSTHHRENLVRHAMQRMNGVRADGPGRGPGEQPGPPVVAVDDVGGP